MQNICGQGDICRCGLRLDGRDAGLASIPHGLCDRVRAPSSLPMRLLVGLERASSEEYSTQDGATECRHCCLSGRGQHHCHSLA
eukprot:1753777-Amphidinium_carterae.1